MLGWWIGLEGVSIPWPVASDRRPESPPQATGLPHKCGPAAPTKVAAPPLCQQILHYIAVNVGKPEGPPLKLVSELRMIDTQTPEHRSVQVVNVHQVFHDVVTVIVGLSVGESRLNAAPPATS